jgi:hypothetical protein
MSVQLKRKASGSTANAGNSQGLRFFCCSCAMGKGERNLRKIVIATPNRNYAAALAAYLRETEPDWETSAFTHEAALRLRLQEPAGIDALIGDPALFPQDAALLKKARRVSALVETAGQAEGLWPELQVYQPLPQVAIAIRGLLADAVPASSAICQMVTLFSASGGAGKTTTALNLARLAGERGIRTLYLNLEPMNATAALLGAGEPDNLSRLMYVLHTEPDSLARQLERFVRHQADLRADMVDAPDHPDERQSMTPDTLELLVSGIRHSGRYELIVVDPDSGSGPLHAKLLDLSDRIGWLVTDDWQCRIKTDKLIRCWRDAWPDWEAKVAFLRNKYPGGPASRWTLPVPVQVNLPYVPQWKETDDPGKLFQVASFSGALDTWLDSWGHIS